MKNFKELNIDRIDNATSNKFKDYLIGTTEINGDEAEIILTDLNSGKENDPWYNVRFRYSGGKLNDIFSFTDPFKIIEEGADLDDFYYFTRSESEEEMNSVMSIIENAIK